jgi:restriction endonuclease S subunit
VSNQVEPLLQKLDEKSINVPIIEEQQKIADFLSVIDK